MPDPVVTPYSETEPRSTPDRPKVQRLLFGRVAFVFAIAPWLGLATILVIRPG
jgi:hypothetical protein